MYKKMLLAGAAGLLVIPVLAAPAMAGNGKLCRDSAGNVKTFNGSKSCKAKFGKGWWRVNTAAAGFVGANGASATASPIGFKRSTAALVNTPAQLATFTKAGLPLFVIPQYDPSLQYTVTATFGIPSAVAGCTTTTTDPNYIATYTNQGCFTVQGLNGIATMQNTTIRVTAKNATELVSSPYVLTTQIYNALSL